MSKEKVVEEKAQEDEFVVPRGVIQSDKTTRRSKQKAYHTLLPKSKDRLWEVYLGDDPDFAKFVGKKFYVDRPYEEVIAEDIVMRQAGIIHRTWLWAKGRHRCPTCGKADNLVFNIQPTGVYLRCEACNVTIGPESPFEEDRDTERADLIAERRVNLTEGRRILARTGVVRLPYGFPSRKQRKRTRKVS